MTHGAQGVLVVHAGIGAFLLIARAIARPFVDRGGFGLYLVLMPAGFQVWFHRSDTDRWLTLALALAGLSILTWTFRRSMNRMSEPDERLKPSHGQ
jgi:hypothetical protein